MFDSVLVLNTASTATCNKPSCRPRLNTRLSPYAEQPPVPRPAPKVTAILGPTNTGKTHFAIERMLAHKSGMIGLPLRLLAREVYDRIVRLRGPTKSR